MARFKKHSPLFTRRLLPVIGAVLIVGGGLFALEKTHIINLYEKKPIEEASADKTTSDVPSAQEDFSGGGEREVGNSLGEGEGSGTVEDLQGVSNGQTDSSKWTSSTSGEIVVHSPYKDHIINNGQELSGTSSLAKVSYRIIDSISGVIAQGELNVVQGKFAGVINFSTSADEGRLDVFGTKPDGSEYTNVEIPIKF